MARVLGSLGFEALRSSARGVPCSDHLGDLILSKAIDFPWQLRSPLR